MKHGDIFRTKKQMALSPYLCPKCGGNKYAVYGEWNTGEMFGICLFCNIDKEISESTLMAFAGKEVSGESLSN